MEPTRLKSLLETLIFVSEAPLKVGEMLEALSAWETSELSVEETPLSSEAEESSAPLEDGLQSPENQLEAAARREASRLSRADIQEALAQLESDYREDPKRGVLLVEVANGWQFRTRPENAAILRGLMLLKPTKLSKPSLETLAIIAYRQPITRAEIDAIRGVDSGGVLKTLMEKNLVRIVGKKEEPGKPMLYGTAQEFMELFQLKSLKDLPTLKEFRELEDEFHRKAGQEGVIVENTVEEEEGDFTLDASPIREALGALEEAEEKEVGDLETSLKDLRKLEREIFAEEKEEATSQEKPEENPSP